MHHPPIFQLLLSALAALPVIHAQTLKIAQTPEVATSTLTLLQPSGSPVVQTLTFLANPSSTHHELRQETPATTSAPSITSIIQATRTESVYIPSASSSSNLDENGIDVEAGASGSSSGGGFSLSKGGMIAVIVVVVCVAVFGGTIFPLPLQFGERKGSIANWL